MTTRAIALAWGLAACGDDVAIRMPDAEPDVPNETRTVDAPLAPAAPEPPRIAPCPSGWIERTTGAGNVYCDPFPGGRLDCEGATYRLPGERGCHPIGVCPRNDWPAELPGDAIYVRPGAFTGDGSRARPFGSLRAALAVAAAGATIALSKGIHAGEADITRDVTIVGACAAETTFESMALIAVSVSGSATLTIRDTSIGAPRGSAIFGTDESAIVLERVRVEPTHLFAIRANGRSLTARDLVVRGGNGVGIAATAVADIEDAMITVDSGDGINLQRGGRLHRVVVRPTVNDLANALAVGAAELTASEVVLVARTAFSASESARAVIDRSYLESLLTVQTSATVASFGALTISRSYLLGGQLSESRAGPLELTDVVIGVPPASRAEETGVAGLDQPIIRLRRVALEGTQGFYLIGGVLDASDVSIVDNVAPSERVGSAIAVIDTRLALERVSIAGGTDTGLLAVHATGTVADTTIRSVLGATQPPLGIAAIEASELDLQRVRVEGSELAAGVAALGAGCRITGHDVAIVDLRPIPGVFSYARGIDIENGASLDLERVAIERTAGHAAIALRQSEMTLRDLTIRDAAACAGDCGGHAFGVGIGAYDAHISAERFLIERAALCAAHLATNGELDLARGTLRGSPVGVCVGVEGYDLDRIAPDVLLDGNDRSLDAVSLPVPRALPPIELEP